MARDPICAQAKSMSASAPLLAECDHLLQQEVATYDSLLALHQEVERYLAAPALDPLLAGLSVTAQTIANANTPNALVYERPPFAGLTDFPKCWCSAVDRDRRNKYPPSA
jgi:hypothetical protein